MKYLEVKNLTKSFTEKPLFNGIDFHINKGEKVALIAKNGAGKSTLLKVLTGEIDRSDGDIIRRKGINIVTLSQSTKLNPEILVIDALFDVENELTQTIKIYEQLLANPETDADQLHMIIEKMEEMQAREYETKVKTIVSKLQITPYLQQKISSLSGGEAKRVALARVLVTEPDFLILDEPTNHLDLEMIERLENYLCTQHVTLFMVTHDRYFLERVCTVIFELDRGNLHKYPGNYSYFLEKKAQREEHETLYMKNLRKLLKQELARMRKAPQGRGSKASYREKKFYDIEDKYDTRKAIIKAEKVPLQMAMEERRLGKKICKLHNVYKSFGEKKIINGFSYDFKNKERIGIIGKNGVGKSTFVNLLLDNEPTDSGKIIIGKTVVFGHYKQNDIHFKHNQRVIDVIREIAEYMYIGKNQRISATKALESFLFPAKQQYTLANNLSGGEKRRLYLLSILIQNPNFLILDEPTNDLDLLTLGILEDFLIQYQGCLLIISHDRFFMDKIVDHLLVFKGDGIIEEFWGSYSDHKKKSKQKSQQEKKEKQSKKENISMEEQAPKKKKLSYNEKREFEKIERDLEKLEKRKIQINVLFDNKDLPYDDIKKLSEELGEIIKLIERHELRWMELSEWI